MGEVATQGREHGAAGQPKHDGHHDEPLKPGLAAVEAIQGQGAAGQVVKAIHEHPDERDEIMKWLQQHRGNGFVQEVTKHLGEVERVLPPGVDLKSVRATFTIPGKRKLTGDWKAAVSTRQATQVT